MEKSEELLFDGLHNGTILEWTKHRRSAKDIFKMTPVKEMFDDVIQTDEYNDDENDDSKDSDSPESKSSTAESPYKVLQALDKQQKKQGR